MFARPKAPDLSQLLTLRQERLAEKARRRFRDFVPQAWGMAEPAKPFIPNWHIDAICDHLQAVSEGHIRKLLITVPPGHAKSLAVSVLWPAWEWIDHPERRAMYTSYDGRLAMRDSVRCRGVLKSGWYQGTFRPKWKFSGDTNLKSWFENDRKGFRMAISVGGGNTGFRGDRVVVDDPLNAKKQNSDKALEEVVFWFDQVMSSRINDPEKGAFVIIMQRLSERDLAAHAIRRGGYEHVNLPTEFEPERRAVTSLPWRDPRTKPGELLFPKLFSAKVIAEAKINLGSQGFAAQHQQRPAPAEGDILKRFWFRFWQPAGANLPSIRFRDAAGEDREAIVISLPEYVDEMIQSWDCSFKGTEKADFVAGHIWGRIASGPGRADAFLLDRVHGRMGFPETLSAVRNLTAKWPGAVAKLIEDKANGTAIIQSLQHEIAGIVPINPLDGKVARARAASPLIEAGNVYLPHPAFAPWVMDFIEECASFPNGRHDDDVDAMTQALARLNSTIRVDQEEAPEDDESPVDLY